MKGPPDSRESNIDTPIVCLNSETILTNRNGLHLNHLMKSMVIPVYTVPLRLVEADFTCLEICQVDLFRESGYYSATEIIRQRM